MILGEGIPRINQYGLVEIRDYFRSHFDAIRIIGYVRAPAS